MDTVGYVVGEVRTDEFTFVTNRLIAPPRLEYIVVQVEEKERRVGLLPRPKMVSVLAQVTRLSVSSRLLDTTLSYDEVASILSRLGSSQPIIVGVAKVLGYLERNVPLTQTNRDYEGITADLEPDPTGELMKEAGPFSVRFPRHAAMPGTPVYRAEDQLLKHFFSVANSGIEVGQLINRDQVSVVLNPNGLRRHLAVIAQTGAGKSFTVGVVLEKLLQLGGTIVVFDPNSDYVLMRRDTKSQPTPFANQVEIYRLPTTQAGRIPDDEIGGSKRFTMKFSELDVDEIAAMCGIPETSTNIRKALQTAHDNLLGTDYSPHIFLQELQHIANGGSDNAEPKVSRDHMPRGPQSPLAGATTGKNDEFSREFRRAAASKANIDIDFDDLGRREETPPDETFQTAFPSPSAASQNGKNDKAVSLDAIAGAQKATKYIERLARVDIWGYEDVPMAELLRPMNLSVIDLAGVDNWISEFVVDKVLRETWGEATAKGLAHPVFFVVEEAHNFVPAGQGARSQAAGIIKRIASEGRKFGIFLVLITQRPFKVHPDTLSQCNSQIIMRLTNPQDQQAIKQSSEGISEGLLSDLPGLNIGEAVILGPIVRVPVMVKIGQRLSQEGGNDIDVVKALENARSEAVIDNREQVERKEKKSRKKSEWVEELDG
ncbi:MAG: ATP-binding protein [Anaerolineae bacterium]